LSLGGGLFAFNALVAFLFLATAGWPRSFWLAILMLGNLAVLLILIFGPNKRVLRRQAQLERTTNENSVTVRVPGGHPSPQAAKQALAFARRVFQRKTSN
jgi:hypothetical protein